MKINEWAWEKKAQVQFEFETLTESLCGDAKSSHSFVKCRVLERAVVVNFC